MGERKKEVVREPPGAESFGTEKENRKIPRHRREREREGGRGQEKGWQMSLPAAWV